MFYYKNVSTDVTTLSFATLFKMAKQDGKNYNAGRIDRNEICESDGERSLSIY